MIEGTLIYDANDGSARVDGVVTPPGARVVMESRDLIAVKWPGTHYYGGQGMPQNYSPGEWIVFEHMHPEGSAMRADDYGEPGPDGKIRVEVSERLRWPLRA